MIFSSFGNAPAEMSFIRMAHAIDEFAKESEEDVFVQVGNTRYEFKYARIVKFLEHEEMVDAMRRASIVVLQGGWGTISEAIFLKNVLLRFLEESARNVIIHKKKLFGIWRNWAV